MAETLVKFVLGRLCDAVFQEVAFLFGVGSKVKLVEVELKRIQCFLKDAGRKRGEDERVRNWIDELRNVLFWIEDTIDTFLLEVDIPGEKEPGIMNKITRTIRKPKKLVAMHKLGTEMDKILVRINMIGQSRDIYGIKNLEESGDSGVRVLAKRPIHPDLDETELVGFGADKERIIRKLLDETMLRRSVVSIVGTGGLGKTTVAQKAYSSDAVKSQFEVRMWLSISQEFQLIDLLKKMLLSIRSIQDREEKLGEEYFLAELNKILREKKYLLVLDDV